MTPTKIRLRTTGLTLAAGALTLAGTMASADQVINDDLIVTFSACIGNDCVNGESFGFDTLRLKENNLRIKFLDTSTSASFPTNDWQIRINDSSNGGGNYFAVEDVSNARTPFRVDAGAPNNALRVDSAGDVGLGNDSPVLELHITDGDSPSIRLEQNGSSGFTPQTFDIAANEANFFVRDVTNGSQLPFKIKPGADSNSLFIAADNDIGIGTDSPGLINSLTDAALHVRRTDGTASVKIEEAGSSSTGFLYMLELTNANAGAGGVAYRMTNGTTSIDTNNIGGEYRINFDDGDNQELVLRANGDLEIDGSFISNGTTLSVPDYVFAPDYELMPLYEVEAFITENRHLPKIPSANEINSSGRLNLTDMQMALLEKVEELTLYTLEQQRTIDALQQRLEAMAD